MRWAVAAVQWSTGLAKWSRNPCWQPIVRGVPTPTGDLLLRRSPTLAVFRQGLPLALGLALHATINLVDLAMVGRLGEDAVQAAHVATTWNFLPMLVGQCVSTALLAWLARLLGAGQSAAARAVNRRAQWAMLHFAVGLGVLTALPAAAMIDATGLQGTVREQAIEYLVVSNLGCLPMFVLMQTTAAMRAVGQAWVPLLLLLLANGLNLAGNWVLLYGCEAMLVPAWGVVGAAYATVGARAIAALLAVAWLCRRDHELSLRGEASVRPRVVLPLLRDAWPQAVQIGLRAGLVLALTILVQQRFGATATTSLGIATRLDTLVLFASLGFASAATAYAGRAVAAGNPIAARSAGLAAAWQAALFGGVCVLGYQCGAEAIVAWFVPQPTVALRELTVLYFDRAAWSQVLGAAAIGAMGAVQGSGHMRAPLLADVVGFTAVAGCMLVPWCSGAELSGIYTGLVVGMVVVAALQLWLVARGRWALAVG